MPKRLIARARALTLFIAMLAGLAAASPAMAQSQDALFHMDRVDVIDAKDLLVERGQINKPFGATLQVTLSGTPLAQDFAGKPIEVRIYRLSDDGSGPFQLNFFRPCLVYYGAVYPIFRDGGVVTVASFNDIHWLNLDGAAHLAPGRFLLIFQRRTNDHDLFRLSLKNGLSEENYFKLGIKLVVGTTYFPPAQVAAYATEYYATQNREAEDAKANHPDLPCYQAHQETQDAKGKITFLEACRTEVDPRG